MFSQVALVRTSFFNDHCPFDTIMGTRANACLKQHLLNGGKSYGSMLMSNSPIVAELMSSMGYGHLIIDHEHSPTDIPSGQLMLQAIRDSRATEPIVRLPSADSVYMKKVLDSMRLSGGVLVPMVEDAATAEAVVHATQYPNGTGSGRKRGCAVPFIRASAWGMDTDYISRCNDELLVMVQVESPQGVEAIDEIANVEGIDMIFLGPMDLSCSIGKMGQFSDPEVKALLQQAEEIVRNNRNVLLC